MAGSHTIPVGAQVLQQQIFFSDHGARFVRTPLIFRTTDRPCRRSTDRRQTLTDRSCRRSTDRRLTQTGRAVDLRTAARHSQTGRSVDLRTAARHSQTGRAVDLRDAADVSLASTAPIGAGLRPRPFQSGIPRPVGAATFQSFVPTQVCLF